MSLASHDGSSLSDVVRSHVGWLHLYDSNAVGIEDVLVRLEDILATLDDDRFPGGLIPRLIDNEMHYYAVAGSHAQRQQLSSLLRASVGPTITDFSGRLKSFQSGDALEELLLENGYTQYLSFTAGSETTRGQYASTALARLRDLVEQASAFSVDHPRTTPQELREFELALAAYDRRRAEEAIRFLRANMRLDAINLGALTVRMHSRFQEWDQICQSDIFPSLCRARRAAKITDLLAEAVYRTHLLTLENEHDLSPSIDAFNETVLPISGNLFRCMPRVFVAHRLPGRFCWPPPPQILPTKHWPNDCEQSPTAGWKMNGKLLRGVVGPLLPHRRCLGRRVRYRGIGLSSSDRSATVARGTRNLGTCSGWPDCGHAVEYDPSVSNSCGVRGASETGRRRIRCFPTPSIAVPTRAWLNSLRGFLSRKTGSNGLRSLDRGDLSVPNDLAADSLGRWKVNEHLRDEETSLPGG